MKAATFERAGVLSIEERPTPDVGSPTDVLVRVLACGICGTDMHILSDPPGHPATQGIVLGHEFVGEVAEVGSAVGGVVVGDRVVVRPILTCGKCRSCLGGFPNHCQNLTALGVFRDGGLAAEVVAPESACIRIDPSIPPHIAALTEPLACVLNAVKRAAPVPGDDVVIFGAGAIGLLFLSVLRAAGAGRIVVVEPTQARAEVAKRMGADFVVNPIGADLAAFVGEHLPDGAGILIDAVGSQLATAVTLAPARARIVLFGMNSHARPEIPQFEITQKELSILGSLVGQNTFPEAIRLLESGRLDLEPIVSDRVSLDDLPKTIDRLREGAVIKAVVLLDGAA